jgi:hypothetical protein
MGIPLEISIFFAFLSIFLLILIGMLLFIDPDFNKSIFALILCFINGVISTVAAVGFMAMDIYGFDSSGVLVSNSIADMYPLGMIFYVFIYFSVMFALYAVFLLYKKPWKQVMQSYGIRRTPWFLE